MEIIWCAEVGSLHKHDLSLAYRMILSATDSGCSIIKFQFGRDPSDPLRHIDLWAPQLAEWCTELGIELMASIWSIEGLRVAQSVGMKRYKIAHQIALSKDRKHGKLVEAVLADGKETFISAPPPKLYRMRMKNARWIYCQAHYPLYPNDLTMPADFRKQGYFGYSSHMHGAADVYLAISRGARYVEKHVCLDHEMVTKDAGFALTYPEYREMKRVGSTIARLC